MQAWSLMLGHSGLPCHRTTDRIFCNAGGHAPHGAGALEAMSDHQLRDIGFNRSMMRSPGDDMRSVPVSRGERARGLNVGLANGIGHAFGVHVRRVLHMVTEWRPRIVSLKPAPMIGDQIRGRIGMVRAEID